MREEYHPFNPEKQMNELSHKLTSAATPLEDRITTAAELFPEERKRSLLQSAEKDRHGRPATCFRLLDYPELAQILEKREITAASRPDLEGIFVKNVDTVRYGLQSVIDGLEPEQLIRLQKDYDYLQEHFLLVNYMTFVLHRLPRQAALELHSHDGMHGNIQGLLSLSIGAPFLPPSNPRERGDYQAGLPVIELLIPPTELIVQPIGLKRNLLEMEKEVNTLRIMADWIVDVYQGEKDFEERFIQDPRSVLYQFWGRGTTHDGLFRLQWNAYDTLQDWKPTESVADLVRLSKLPELDVTNPIYRQPILEDTMVFTTT